jgi:uncharacterized membrane protein
MLCRFLNIDRPTESEGLAMGVVVRGVVLVAATVASGMIAGLFYAYACSVMPALRGADDRTFVDVMQRVNRAIQNGWFSLSFVGSVLATVAVVLLNLDGDRRAVLLPAGLALALHIAALVVTFGRNIPMNNRLDAGGPAARLADPADARRAFEVPWTRFNLLRTLLTLAAFVALCVASVEYGRVEL